MAERFDTQETRYCPNCGKVRGVTGPAFCNGYCELKYQEWLDYADSGEFEADVAVALAEPQMILG